MTSHEVSLVFPHQLFSDHPALKKERPVLLVEDPLFFGDFRFPLAFHKQKLLLHRASMAAYMGELRKHGFEVDLVRYEPERDVTGEALNRLTERGTRAVFAADPTDWALSKRLERACSRLGIRLRILSTPAFLCHPDDLAPTPSGRPSMTSFYVAQRKRRKVLLDEAGRPLGGKWSFDPANRRKLPGDLAVPVIPFPPNGPHVREAARSVDRDFPDNPGRTAGFFWPVTHDEAHRLLDDFVEHRLPFFGNYEDAMSLSEKFLFHSALSSSLNTGLLTPDEVIEVAMERLGQVPLNCLEGFVRQVMGWREFMRLVYLKPGVGMRNAANWGHRRPLPPGFRDGETGILPVDTTIRRIRECAYAHHIERLMVLGSFLLLCETDPDEVYRWFMAMFIDAYDWVMVPNVYAMSQFSAGELITTKPYFCASSYLLRMGDWKKGSWCELLDGLFWRFVAKNREVLRANPRLGPMTANLDRMDRDRLAKLMDRAERYLEE